MKPELLILQELLSSVKDLKTVVKSLCKDSCGNYIESSNSSTIGLVEQALDKADKVLQESFSKEKEEQERFEKKVMGREYRFREAEKF